MITLLASIAGFISSLIPDLLKFIRDKNNKKHQLDVIDHQIKAYDKGITTEFEAYKLKSDTDEAKNLYSTYKSGFSFIDIINASVRPILAYAFFGLYALIKYRQYLFLETEHNIDYLINDLWTVDDQAIFAGIISFYFGQRAFIKRITLSKLGK